MELKELLISGELTAKLISTTNRNFEYFTELSSGTLYFTDSVAWYGALHTSYVIGYTWNKDDSTISIKTRNSTYIFEILDEVPDDSYEMNISSQDVKTHERKIREW